MMKTTEEKKGKDYMKVSYAYSIQNHYNVPTKTNKGVIIKHVPVENDKKGVIVEYVKKKDLAPMVNGKYTGFDWMRKKNREISNLPDPYCTSTITVINIEPTDEQ